MIHPVILCGGAGTRLWPASRHSYPKQFSYMLGAQSSFQHALQRVNHEMFHGPTVVTIEDYRFIVQDQTRSAGVIDAEIVLEPVCRNTGPAVLVAALMLYELDRDAQILVLPSDHIIRDRDAFLEAVKLGAASLETGGIVAFGVAPDRPETGYGWLETADPASTAPKRPVSRFHEKPELALAEDLLGKPGSLWNAGIFLARAEALIAEFEEHAPELLDPCRMAVKGASRDTGFVRLATPPYIDLPSISIDRALMEKSESLHAVLLGAGWADIGNWASAKRVLSGDCNTVATSGAATSVRCENTLLLSEESDIQVVGLGLRNVAVVATRDAVLVADLNEAEHVGEVVELLRESGCPQAMDYPRFHRPWGWYETLCLGDRFRVKRIMVKPGGKLSLQSHVHRAEHWVVVSGMARVTVDRTERLMSENESVYIPVGAVHRMENPGKAPMYLIEVQTGTYLEEDDIVRYEDIYSRV